MPDLSVEMPKGENAFWSGVKAAVPIMIGYWPAAMAFGAACFGAGLSPWHATAMSVFIYAGAAQFILLNAVTEGSSWVAVVALCALLNARHLLYGPLIAALLPKDLRTRLCLSAGLTDEVFATSLAHLQAPENENQQQKPAAWFGGLALASYLSWVGGTVLGASLGAALEQTSPHVSAAMQFAFPALFLVLAVQCLSPAVNRSVLAAGVTAGAFAWAGYSGLAIVAGAIMGIVCHRRPEPRQADNAS